jgi:hypothetical protein
MWLREWTPDTASQDDKESADKEVTNRSVVPLELLTEASAVGHILVELAQDLSHLVQVALLLLDLELVCLRVSARRVGATWLVHIRGVARPCR